MLLSAIPPQTHFCNSNCHSPSNCNLLFCPHNSKTPPTLCKPTTATAYSSAQRSLFLTKATSSSSSTSLRHVSHTCSESEDERDGGEEEFMVLSASAVAQAIRSASNSPVEFVQRLEKDGNSSSLVLPSPDFQRLCVEQLELFRRIVHPEAVLSVYVRPAGSYIMDRLELRRITFYPGSSATDIVILVGNFSVPTGLRAAEAALSSQLAEFFPDLRAVVFPMVKHPFIVGFLVAELPEMVMQEEDCDVKPWPSVGEHYVLPPVPETDAKLLEIPTGNENTIEIFKFNAERRSNASSISRSLAMAYVMDQKAMLLQQSSWQNNIRMSNLVEQIRGSLSSIRTLSKMLSIHVKKSEISYDIVEDILVQGDNIRDTLHQLQDAVHLTKANIMRFNEESLRKMQQSPHIYPESVQPRASDNISVESSVTEGQKSSGSLTSASKDIEMPMPPLALAPLCQEGTRPCNVSDLLIDLVGAVEPLARKQQRAVELCELSISLQVAVEEPALRQALSNLIEGALLRTQVGGKVEILSTQAPAGGALVIIDDDGLDMHYMTQMHSLTPFGSDLFSKDKVEDNMTWNFVAGLTVAREILESYGCVVRVISPRTTDAALGVGGTRVELWLPSPPASTNTDNTVQEA